jgi:DNA primase
MRLTVEQRISLEFAAASYAKNIDQAAEYLSGRGFSEESAHEFRLGVVVEPVPGDDQFTGRLSIPYITRSGVVDIRYRCLQQHDCKEVNCKKYLGHPGKPLRLFNVEGLFVAGDFIVLCEGELDTIAATQAGFPAVGVPGTGGWKPHFNRIFEDYQRVYLFADGDEAGKKFGAKLSAEVSAIVVPMPDGEDVNSTYLKYGEEYLRSRIDE